MLRHYGVTAARHMARDRVTSLPNILGLALGLACSVLVLQWVRYVLSWDSFHQHLDKLYVVTTTLDYGTGRDVFLGAPPALGPALAEEFPEVVEVSRCKRRACVLQHGDRTVALDLGDSRFVDPSFLTLMSFPVLHGNAATALARKHDIVLCKSLAMRLFGDADPRGQTVTLDYMHELEVTAILDDVPRNSTLQFDSLLPIEWIGELSNNLEPIDVWYNCSFLTIARLHPETDKAAVAAKIRDRALREKPEIRQTLSLFPFADLHLYSIDGKGGYIDTVRTVAVVALLVLLIACLNFTNLATARAGGRAKEVALRKVAGARRKELIVQFYSETLLQSLIAMAVALVLAERLLPMFRRLTGYPIRLDYGGDPGLWVALLAVTVCAGIASGTYPAMILSSFRPVTALRGPLGGAARGVWFRRILVVLQFGAATVLLICTVVVYTQFEYLRSRSTGFDTRNLLHFRLDPLMQSRFEALKEGLLQHPGVVSVSHAGYPPVFAEWTSSQWQWEGKDPTFNPLVTENSVGREWLYTLGLEMVEGRFFAPEGDPPRSVVINETLAAHLGNGPVVGRWMRNPQEGLEPFTVIGVVRDFHFETMFRRLEPLLLTCDPFEDHSQWYALVRVKPENLGETLTFIEHTVARINPGRLLEWDFLEDELQRRYGQIRFRAVLLRDFALVAIFIACLGLFGLASFLTERRSKEIGIRKVFGASVPGVVTLLVRDFLRWVALANLIAWPIAYLLVRRWLEQFAYRVDIEPAVFLCSAAVACAVAVATVSVRAIQAARANPVDAIRYE